MRAALIAIGVAMMASGAMLALNPQFFGLNVYTPGRETFAGYSPVVHVSKPMSCGLTSEYGLIIGNVPAEPHPEIDRAQSYVEINQPNGLRRYGGSQIESYFETGERVFSGPTIVVNPMVVSFNERIPYDELICVVTYHIVFAGGTPAPGSTTTTLLQCAPDVRACPDGQTYVSRSPVLGCEFPSCPSGEEPSNSVPTERVAGGILFLIGALITGVSFRRSR